MGLGAKAPAAPAAQETTMAKNAPDSPWLVTPQAKRHRKNIMLTLPEDVIERLTKQAGARGVSRSLVVEALILAAPIRERG